MAPVEPAPISFARGAPSLDIVDVDGLRAAADRAFRNDPAGTTAYGTAIGYRPLRAWIADKHGVDVDQVVVTNGSMQADAFLFEALVEAGDAVVVEKPTYDRTLLSLRYRGADVRPVDLERDGIDVEALAALLAAGLRPEARAHHPQLPEPRRLHAVARRSASALLALAPRDGFVRSSRTTRTWSCASRGASLPTMLSLDEADSVVYASSFSKTVCPGIRVGYLVGPAKLIARIVEARDQHVHLAEHGRAVDRQRVRARQRPRSSARSRRVKGALHERVAARWPPRCGASCPRRASSIPRAATSCGSSCPRAPTSTRCSPPPRERGVAIVKGTDFLLEGGENSAAPRLLRRHGPTQIDEGVAPPRRGRPRRDRGGADGLTAPTGGPAPRPSRRRYVPP